MPPQQLQDTEAAWKARSAELADCITRALRQLLEGKHLYQHVDVTFGDWSAVSTHATNERITDLFRDKCKKAVDGPWDLADNTGHYRKVGIDQNALRPQVPGVKLFCTNCERVEAFNPVSAEDMLGRDREKPHHELDGKTVQVLALSFLCQSCKSVPEVMLIRREGTRLTLAGRSPMEHTPVPSAIPKAAICFYRDAVIAHQCGKTLPGLFMLRTLIEQWVRSLGHNQPWASDAIEAYRGSLPDDFRSRYPCLKKEYEDLSKDIHAALGSKELFEDVRRRIDLHFNARDLFTQADPDVFRSSRATPSPPPTPPTYS
jgi:hypothetical protein